MGSSWVGINNNQLPEFVLAFRRAVTAVTSASGLDEVLVDVLDGCSEWPGPLYPSIALLHAQGDLLMGRVVSPPHVREAIRRASKSAGIPLDSFFGQRGERRAIPRNTKRAGIPPDALSYELDATDNLVVQVFRKRSALITSHYHDLVWPRLQGSTTAVAKQALGIQWMCVLPLTVEARCLGVLAVAFGPGERDAESDVPSLELFAGQAALAIEMDCLHRELRDREQQVSLLLKATIDAQEEERERICLEIHDGVAQRLAAAFHHLQTLDVGTGLPSELRSSIARAGMLVRDASREAREIIATLRPAALDALGLVATLRYEVEDLQRQVGWQVDFQADDVRFPKAVETALYRIAHEAVSNVTKHARASRVAVRVKQEQGHIAVEVEDNGVGFDFTALSSRLNRKGVGLLSMRKRTELLQGSIQITSNPGSGTRVQVVVPLPGGE